MTNPERTKSAKSKISNKEKSTKLLSCQKCRKAKNTRELIEGLCADCRQPTCAECGANHPTADCKQKKVEVDVSDEEELEEVVEEIPTKEQTISQLETNLTTKSQELTQSQELITKLQQENQTLKQTIKTQTETLKNTQKELTQANQRHQNHLSQEKVQLTQEIQLIKEVIQ